MYLILRDVNSTLLQRISLVEYILYSRNDVTCVRFQDTNSVRRPHNLAVKSCILIDWYPCLSVRLGSDL